MHAIYTQRVSCPEIALRFHFEAGLLASPHRDVAIPALRHAARSGCSPGGALDVLAQLQALKRYPLAEDDRNRPARIAYYQTLRARYARLRER